MSSLAIRLALGLAAATAAFGQSGGPRIAVEPAEHDFGRIIEGAKPSTEFRIRNLGTAELVIDKVTASCGCTVPMPESRQIAAGGETRMPVSFDSTGRQGAWRGSVTLYSNDPNQRLVIQLKADVVPEVRISETYLYFGEIFRGTAETREIVIENVSYDSLAIEKYHVEGDHFEVEMLANEVGTKGGKAVFKIGLKKDAPYGYCEGNLYVRTNYDRNPLFRIFLIARVKGYVDLSRPRIDFGILVRSPALTGRKEKVSLYSHKEAIEVQSVTTDLPYLDVDVAEVSPGRSFDIVLTIKDGAALGQGSQTFPARVNGNLVIRTTSTERPVIEVSVLMIVKTED